jgi:AraC-like DNA-binding protein
MEIGEIFKNYHKFKINKSDFLAKLFVQLTNEIFVHEMSQNEMVIHIIDQIMILFAREAQKSSLKSFDDAHISQIIEQNIIQDPLHHWTVAEMASLVQLGLTAFSERMKMETGLSPINFLIKIRINIAMNLMAHFNYKIGDIAYETGFYSPQHFSLTFKKMTGISPHKYRKNLLQ